MRVCHAKPPGFRPRRFVAYGFPPAFTKPVIVVIARRAGGGLASSRLPFAGRGQKAGKKISHEQNCGR